jgi:hypothetical protein
MVKARCRPTAANRLAEPAGSMVSDWARQSGKSERRSVSYKANGVVNCFGTVSDLLSLGNNATRVRIRGWDVSRPADTCATAGRSRSDHCIGPRYCGAFSAVLGTGDRNRDRSVERRVGGTGQPKRIPPSFGIAAASGRRSIQPAPGAASAAAAAQAMMSWIRSRRVG